MKRLLNILISIILFFVSYAAYGQTMAKRDTVLIGRIEFVVNTITVVDNEQYRHFVDEMLPFMKENKDRIIKTMVIGSASPEGNKQRNLFLADNRAKRAIQYLKGVVDEKNIEVVNNDALFVHISKCKEENYVARRGAYIEVWVRGENIRTVTDTLRLEQIDTVYIHDTLYIEKPYKKIPILAVKTNLVADALITPNVQAELYTHLWGLSLEFDYTFPWYHKDYGTYFYYQLLNGTVGIRKYLKKDYTGHYFGIYANTAIYDICPFNKDHGWQGEIYGAGLSYGYVFQHKRYSRLKFEPYIRIGWFNNRFDEYHASQPWDEKYYYNWYQRASDFVPRRLIMNYFGPTEIGFNFTIDIVCLRKY